MATVIVSSAVDYHAEAVKWALESAGLPVCRWDGLGTEGERQAAFIADAERGAWLGSRQLSAEDTVWFRRPLRFNLSPSMSAVDRVFARGEGRMFRNCLYEATERVCRCINPWASARSVDLKLYQLWLARECGMRVPRTIMGNNASRVRAEVERGDAQWIHKCFLPHSWEHKVSGRIAMATTSELGTPIPVPDATLGFAPGIFQKRVGKELDVRLIAMGQELYAFAWRASAIDGRTDLPDGPGSLRPVPVPKDVAASLRSFIARAKLSFGCYDFGVDQDGTWWFFEVNESGQFLWIDEVRGTSDLFHDFLRYLSGCDERVKFPPLSDFKFTRATIEGVDIEDPFNSVEG